MSGTQFRTPLGRVRALGSAKSGTGHFWHQRLTAIANVPLTIAFVIILVSLLGRSHATVVQTLGSPLVAIVMLPASTTWRNRLRSVRSKRMIIRHSRRLTTPNAHCQPSMTG